MAIDAADLQALAEALYQMSTLPRAVANVWDYTYTFTRFFASAGVRAKAMMVPPPSPFPGVDWHVDPSLPPGTVEFRQDDKVAGRIMNIGTPQEPEPCPVCHHRGPCGDPSCHLCGWKEPEARKSAAVVALDAIAALSGCPEWEYPAQVIRDAEGLLERARKAEAERDALQARVDTLEEESRRWYLSSSSYEVLTPEEVKRRRREAADRLAVFEADLRAAAGELPVPCPEPGTDMARLLMANRLLKTKLAEAEKRLSAIEAAMPASYYAGRPLEKRVDMMVRHWNRAILRLKDIVDAQEDQA